jgi:hypothetical protein
VARYPNHLPHTSISGLVPAEAPVHITPHDQPDSLTALEHMMRTTNASAAALAQLVDHLTGINEPPDYRPLTFNVGDQTIRDQDDRISPSFGYYNPDPTRGVWLDITGAGADARSHALYLPPNTTGCFPVKVRAITLALDAPAASTLVLHTWRYRTLQPLN